MVPAASVWAATRSATAAAPSGKDVDDYDGWSASPPEDKNGNPLVGFDDWGRSVSVEWVNPDNPDAGGDERHRA